MTFRHRNLEYPVNIQAMMSTGQTAKFQRPRYCLPGDCLDFYVYPVVILAMMSIKYTALDVNMGIRILTFPVYPVDHPWKMSTGYTADCEFQALQFMMF